jgi:hypothetical protein
VAALDSTADSQVQLFLEVLLHLLALLQIAEVAEPTPWETLTDKMVLRV